MPASTTNKLFRNNAAWQLDKLPEPFASMKNKNTDPNGISPSFNNKGYSRMNRDITRAILNIRGYAGEIDGYLYGDYAVVQVSFNTCAAERKLADGTHEVCVYNSNGELRAAKISATGRYEPFDTLGSPNTDVDVSTICLALLGNSLSGEVKSMLNEGVYDVAGLTDEQANDLFWLNDYIYQTVNYDPNLLNVNIAADGNLSLVTKKTVESGAYNGTVIAGTPDILCGNSGKIKSKSKNLTMKEAKKEFAAFSNKHDWTDEERKLIPSFDDNFPVPPEAMRIARRYVDSKDDIRPMVNFMWRGVTAYGKSTGVEAIAAMLDMPLLRMTCHTNMETQNFLSDFVPDTSSADMSQLPDFETIKYDPVGAYLTITGVEDSNATQDMCLKAYGEAIAKQNSATPRFKHVESNFVKGITRGYIVEIQECSRIKDSGVLVGLNEYDRPGAVIPLINGTYAKRHPDAVVIYTDNVGYESCRTIDPSVIRRMSFIIDSYELPKERVLERIKYNTGYTDTSMLNKCYDIWSDLAKYAKEHDITEGTISVNELEMLVQSIKYDGELNFDDNVRECIIAKATSDKDEQDELYNSYFVNHSAF